MRCQYCGLDVDLPFKCPFCGRYFCAEHRLPEFHACQGIKRGQPYHEVPLRRGNETFKVSISRRFSSGFSRLLHRVSSLVELAHLTLGVLLVMLVGFSISFSEMLSINLLLVFYLALIFALSFILHEFGHKFTAKYYGLWAEFRLSLIGVMITLISAFSPIKIISPGAVVVSGEATRENLGKIALSGPFINISLSILFLALNLTFDVPSFKIIFAWGSAVNAYVALFNLIPFGFLDGAKIFWWNKYVWIMGFLMALTLVITNLVF